VIKEAKMKDPKKSPSYRALERGVAALAAGEPELKAVERDFFMPQLLNDLVWEGEQEASSALDWLNQAEPDALLDPTEFIVASPSERIEIERNRLGKVQLMLETLMDKYANALRTDRLLERISAKKTGFVLFLRGFSLKEHYYSNITAGHEQDLEEYRFRFELAEKLAPAPLMLVRNPAMSESLLAQFPGAKPAAENTYLLDLDATWEADVRTLAAAASFICVRNKLANPGLRTEVGILRDLGRLNETYFSHPEAARTLIANGPTQALDEAAVSRMRESTDQRVRPLAHRPRPTCLWLQAKRRDRSRDNALFTFDLFNRWADRGQTMPRDMQTRLMAGALAISIALERPDLIVMTFGSYGQILGQYGQDQLPERDDRVRYYFSVAQSLARAIDQTATSMFNYQDLNVVKALMRSEKPDELVRCIMQCVAALPEAGN
jgi:hypothetical protein